MKKRILSIILIIVIAVTSYYLFTHDTPKTPVQQTQKTTTGSNTPDTPNPPISFDKTKYSTSDPASIWVVVNKQRALSPKTYAPDDLVAVGGGQQMRAAAATALAKMIADAKNEGLYISPLSGYRSYYTQVSVYGNEVTSNGQAVADSQSARPGHSEHQTGLAVDVGGGGCGIEDCFGNTAAGKWVAAHAYKYGFIIRYTAAKEPITGYRAEPWHIRYIGVDLSSEMQKQGVLTLEEFFGLPAAPSY